MTICRHVLESKDISSCQDTHAPNNIPLYNVVKIHGSTGWKSIPFTRSLRANNCLYIWFVELAEFTGIFPDQTVSCNTRFRVLMLCAK